MNMNTNMRKETATPPRSGVNPDEVAQRAYQFWEAAGRPPGRDLEFWLQAEAEIRSTRHSHSLQARLSGEGIGYLRKQASG
jgi:Protein of unknown function (DUF2934)